MGEFSFFVVDYGDGPQIVEVSTVAELDTALDKAADESKAFGRPFGVQVYTERMREDLEGPLLTLGVGADFSFLSYDEFYVQGDLDGGDHSAWWYGNDWTYRRPGQGIPVGTAREAARQFVRTGRRPKNVEWIEGD